MKLIEVEPWHELRIHRLFKELAAAKQWQLPQPPPEYLVDTRAILRRFYLDPRMRAFTIIDERARLIGLIRWYDYSSIDKTATIDLWLIADARTVDVNREVLGSMIEKLRELKAETVFTKIPHLDVSSIAAVGEDNFNLHETIINANRERAEKSLVFSKDLTE